MEKKCKKAKWLSGEALQIAVKRREAKSKGEKVGFHWGLTKRNCIQRETGMILKTEGRTGSDEAVPGPSVFPTGEPVVSGDFWWGWRSSHCRAEETSPKRAQK